MNYREVNMPCVDEGAVREPESVMELIRESEDIANRRSRLPQMPEVRRDG